MANSCMKSVHSWPRMWSLFIRQRWASFEYRIFELWVAICSQLQSNFEHVCVLVRIKLLPYVPSSHQVSLITASLSPPLVTTSLYHWCWDTPEWLWRLWMDEIGDSDIRLTHYLIMCQLYEHDLNAPIYILLIVLITIWAKWKYIQLPATNWTLSQHCHVDVLKKQSCQLALQSNEL